MSATSSAADRKELIERFRRTIDARREDLIALLDSLCAIESGSEMIEGVDRVVDVIGQRLTALGMSVRREPADGFADHLVATNGMEGPQIVLGGHLDTTYTDYSALPAFRIEGELAYGPGTGDMRGGVLVFLAALECLREAGLGDSLPITVVLNTDEERGAPTSRPIFQDLAKRTRAALFSECAGPAGEVVVSRRAKLSYRLDVKGEGKHAGGKDNTKVSALTEMAHKIIAAEALSEVFPGASVNVGRAWGGIASNTVPERATALIDIRYPESAQEAPIREAMRALAARADVPGARSQLVETSFRPAWQKTDANAALFSLVEQAAGELGQRVAEESRGGTADANWFGAAGVPTVDGLGPIGFDDHTPQERIVLESLFERALLVATVLVHMKEGGDNVPRGSP